MSEYEVSKCDECVDHLRGRMIKRLENVVWGINAQNLQEALTFSEGYLVDDLEPEMKEKVLDCLLQSGFSFCTRLCNDAKSTIWSFPKKPEGWCKDIYDFFDKFYQQAVKDAEVGIRQGLRSYFTDKRQTYLFKTYDSVTRECLLAELATCNRELYVRTTAMQDWVYLAKTQEQIPLIERHAAESEAQYKVWLQESIKSFYKFLDMVLERQLYILKIEKEFNFKFEGEKEIGKYVYFAPLNMVNDITRILEADGFHISIFPEHSEDKYAGVWVKTYGTVELYATFDKYKLHHVQKLCKMRS